MHIIYIITLTIPVIINPNEDGWLAPDQLATLSRVLLDCNLEVSRQKTGCIVCIPQSEIEIA